MTNNALICSKLVLLLALLSSLCACGADISDREVSEGGYLDPNGGKAGSAGVIIDPNGGKGSSSGGTIDPNGKTVSLRAEWMD